MGHFEERKEGERMGMKFPGILVANYPKEPSPPPVAWVDITKWEEIKIKFRATQGK
jgi:hypothetical protein